MTFHLGVFKGAHLRKVTFFFLPKFTQNIMKNEGKKISLPSQLGRGEAAAYEGLGQAEEDVAADGPPCNSII